MKTVPSAKLVIVPFGAILGRLRATISMEGMSIKRHIKSEKLLYMRKSIHVTGALSDESEGRQEL
jgi:hypothetical protein